MDSGTVEGPAMKTWSERDWFSDEVVQDGKKSVAHWYRDPKRLKFLEYLNRAEAEFVLDRGHFLQDELLRLRSTLNTSIFADKVSRGECSSEGSLKVLIVAHEKPTGTVTTDTKQWAGIFVVPGDSPRKESTLADLFLINPFFPNGEKGSRVVAKGILRPRSEERRVGKECA